MIQKSIHPHKTWEDEQENNKDYGAHRPNLLPLLLCLILPPIVLDLIACVLPVGLQQYLKHMVTLLTSTMFLIVFLAGEAEGIIMASVAEAADVVAVLVVLGSFLFL